MQGNLSQLLSEVLFSKILNPAYRKSRALKKPLEHDMIDFLLHLGVLPIWFLSPYFMQLSWTTASTTAKVTETVMSTPMYFIFFSR